MTWLLLKLSPFLLLLLFWSGKAEASVLSRAPNNLGLVGYWSMNDGAGATASDFSGNKNQGTLTSMDPSTDWVNGRHGKALDFDGSNDYVDASNLTYNANFPLTVSMWIYPRTSANVRGFLQYGDSGATPQLLFRQHSDDSFRVYVSDVYTDYGTLSINAWNHVAIVRGTGGTGDAYLNGVDVGNITATGPGAAQNARFWIGREAFATNQYFDGLIDDVRIYNRALSAAQVYALYRAGEVRQRNPNNSGLVGYWSMNDGATATTTDSSGLGNHGTLTNMDPSTDWVNGRHGKALSFDGSNDYVDYGTNSVYSLTNNFTVATWFKVNAYGNYGGLVTHQNSTNGWGLVENGGSGNVLSFIRFNAGTFTYLNINANPPTGEWHHLAGVIRNGTRYTYLDGVQQTATDTNLPGANTTINGVIGRFYGNVDNYYFNGLIDEVRVYNRALTAAQVYALYRAGEVAQRNPNNSGLVGYWSMNDGAGATATDFSGNKKNGTLTNMDPSTDWVNGRHGKALDFDGSNDYVDVGTGLDQNGAVTMSAWIKTNTVAVGIRDIVTNCNSAGNACDYAFEVNRTAGKVTLLRSAAAITVTSNASLSANVWYHVVGVLSGSSGSWTGTIYINGVLDKSGSDTNNPSGSNETTTIGRAGAGSSYYFNGLIDDVRVYNRALSAAEVRALYDSR